jgi:hypothetical protein
VDNLITNKSVAISEAYRGIVNTQCVETYVLANVEKFLKTLYCWVNNASCGNGK